MKIIKGIFALIAIVTFAIGVPLAVFTFGGVPFADGLPSGSEIADLIKVGYFTDPFFISLLQSLALVAYVFVLAALIVEIFAQVRGVKISVKGLAAPRRMVSSLVGAVIAIGGLSPLAQAAAIPDDGAQVLTVTQGVTGVQGEQGATGDTVTQGEQGFVHVVAPGESLWSLAEHYYGDGSAYHQIIEANQGVLQQDGKALEESSGWWIEVGWQLQIPNIATPEISQSVDVSLSESQTHVVAPGESLWSIADEVLGDGSKYSELSEINNIVNPSLLHPGTVLNLPQDSLAPLEVVAEQDQEADIITQQIPVIDQVAAQENQTPPAPAQTPVTQENQTPSQDSVEVVAEQVKNINLPFLISGSLVTGLAALLVSRKVIARHNRKPGQRLVAPEAEESVLETHIMASADPLSVNHIDRALRSLGVYANETQSPLPDLRAAFFAPGAFFKIYLESPSSLPAPWVCEEGSDNQVWVLSSADALLIGESDGISPYPALVTIGQVEDGSHLLLNLEALDTFAVRGAESKAALAALAIEMACASWSDDMRVTLVGLLEDVETDLGARVRHVRSLDKVIAELEHRAGLNTQTLTEAGVNSVADARNSGLLPDHNPEIILVSDLSPAERLRLEAVVSRIPRIGIAAVCKDQDASWVLDVDENVLSPLGLDVVPQKIDDKLLQESLSLLSPITHEPAPTGFDVIADEISAADAGFNHVIKGDDLVEVRFDDPKFAPVLPSTPLVRVLLGVPEVVNVQGKADPKTLKQSIETVAVIAFNPGISSGGVAKALWPIKSVSEATKRSVISRARAFLGASKEGVEYLPRITGVSGSGYVLKGVQTDWDLFKDLVGPDLSAAPLEDLIKALRLVDDRPFNGVRAEKYIWAEALMQDMVSTIMDVIHEVASRALASGMVVLARDVAGLGRRVEPVDERVWRDAMKAESALGQVEDAYRLAEQLRARFEDLELEIEDETAALVVSIKKRVNA